MKKNVTEEDGNCLFSAVAFSIITNLLSEPHKQLLKDVGIDPSLDEKIKNIADQLRSVMVREWIENSSHYG